MLQGFKKEWNKFIYNGSSKLELKGRSGDLILFSLSSIFYYPQLEREHLAKWSTGLVQWGTSYIFKIAVFRKTDFSKRVA